MSNVTCLNEPSSIKSIVNVGILLNATYACTNTHTHAVQHNDQQTKCAIFFSLVCMLVYGIQSCTKTQV